MYAVRQRLSFVRCLKLNGCCDAMRVVVVFAFDDVDGDGDIAVFVDVTHVLT